MRDMRIVTGTRYTQADRLDRDQAADFARVLADHRDDGDALNALHALGYDCSDARIRHYLVRREN